VNRQPLWQGLLLLSVLACGWLLAAPDPGELEPLVPVHADAKQLLTATADALQALLMEDAAAARDALDRIDAQIRELKAEEQVHYGPDLVSYTRALKQTLNTARETSVRGDIERAFDEFIAIQLTCRTCHDVARSEGLVVMGRTAPEESAKH